MGHAKFSPTTQDVVCSASEPYYVTVSHERTTGHDRKDSNPQTIISGYKPSNDTRFTVDRSWEEQISSNWTKTFKFEGIFLGSVTIKHHSYYQNWRTYQWKTRTDWRYATFNIWLPSHSNVSYKKLWNPIDKTIFITYKAESAEKLDEIIGKQISIYNYEPSNIATLSGYRWEKVSEKEAKLYLDIGYNFLFVKRIIKISAGTTNLCTVVQIGNKSFWKSANRTTYASDGTSVVDSLSIGSGGFISSPFFIAEGKISIIFEKNVSFLEAYPVDDFSPEQSIVPENDISLINVEVNKAEVLFTANVEEYYDYCRGAFIFTDGTNVFGRVIAVQCENAFLQGGTNPKVERTFFSLNYNKDVYPVRIWQDSYSKFLKNPMFLLLGYKDYSPVFSFVFDGVKNYRTETGYYWWQKVPAKDTAEFIISYSDGSTKKICMRYRASAYKNSDKDIKLFATLSDSGEIEEVPNENLEDGGNGDIIFKVGKYNPYLLFKRESGALIKAHFTNYLYDKFPRTLRNIDKSEMTKVYETPILFPVVGKYYANDASEETKEIGIFYGISEIRSAIVEFEIAPLYKEYGSEIISAEAFCYSIEPRGGYYNNIVETKVEKRDGRFFVIIKARQSSFIQDYRYNIVDSTSTWGIRWTENKRSPISVTSKKRVSFLFYRSYPHVFNTTIVSLNGVTGSTVAYLDKSKTSTPYRVRVKSSRFSSSLIGFSFVEGEYKRKECSATLVEHDEKTNEWEYELLAVPSSYWSNTVTCFVNAKFEFGNLGIKTIEASYKYNRPAIKI